MNLPVLPPLIPMLARLARQLPGEGHVYEPKWDGFRALAFRDGDDVDIRSRNGRPFARYFPELVEGLRSLTEDRFVVDGEIVVVTDHGFDFQGLMSRLHPAASRVSLLRTEAPATLVAFDLLALGDDDLRSSPFAQRRTALERLLAGAEPPMLLTTATDDVQVAGGWLERFQGGGIDGVVAKAPDLRYLPGKRAMVKVKLEQTADCVVAGYRMLADRPALSSLLLSLHDEAGQLHHVGVAAAFSESRRTELLDKLRPLKIALDSHPWRDGFLAGGNPMGRLKGAAGAWTPDMGLDWVPIRPELVCEVGYDQLDRDRFRHAARFRRWRPDRDPRSCTFDQFLRPSPDPSEVLSPA